MAGSALVYGLLALAAAGGAYLLTRDQPKTPTPTTTPGGSVANCMAMLEGLPKASPTVAEGLLRVGTETATSIPAGTDPKVAQQKVADAMADYLSAHGYPNIAACLHANPSIVGQMKSIPLPTVPGVPAVPPMTDVDCAKTLAALPADVSKRVQDIAAALPASQIAVAAAQAAAALDALGYHEAAACIRQSPTLLLPPDTPLTLDACTAEIKAIPPAVIAAIVATNPKSAEDVAYALDAQGYKRAAQCVRNYPTIVPSIPTTGSIPGVPGLPPLPIPPSTFLAVGP